MCAHALVKIVSDGLWDCDFDVGALDAVLRQGLRDQETLKAIADNMANLALKDEGGDDNICVVLVDLREVKHNESTV